MLYEYDDYRWIFLFLIIKASVFRLSKFLRPHIQRQNIIYRLAILVMIRVSYTLLKLAQGSSMQLCSKLFAFGTSTMSSIIQGTCHAINVVLRHEITRPIGARLVQTEHEFKRL